MFSCWTVVKHLTVNYVKFFSILTDRGLCQSVLIVLLNLYTNQCMRIKWGSSCSDKFNVFNGVKQGGILCPILFIIFLIMNCLEISEKVNWLSYWGDIHWCSWLCR